MKEIIVSNCEKTFIQNAIADGMRLDGRSLNDCRSLKICFGSDLGSCHVSLGNTKVVAHTSCKVSAPKQMRPNEGLLYINVELGTMGAPNFEANRQSDLNVYLDRLIEKCMKESRCIDLESLCIVSEEKVWSLRVDIHVLNHAGNLIECASIAALTSLAHFKRPDVTTSGEDIIIHTLTEKDPIPIVLHHHPVCVSFGLFADGTMVSDPSLLEETVCNMVGGLLVVGMNPYREICLLDLAGAAVTSGPDVIFKATQKAVNRVQYIVKEIKDALAEDEKLRAEGKPVGFANAIPTNQLMTLAIDKLCLKLSKFDLNMSKEDMMRNIKKRQHGGQENVEEVNDSSEDEVKGIVLDNGLATLVPKTVSTKKGVWTEMGSDEEAGNADDISDAPGESDVQITKIIKAEDRIVAMIDVSSGSEEEVIMLEPEEVKKSVKNKKKKKNKNKNHH